jgi:hypothetical protein
VSWGGFARPPDRDELVRAISYLAGQAQVQRQTAAAVAGEVAESWLMGTGLEELADPAAGFKLVTAEAVRELAKRYLDPDLRVEGIVRGRNPAGLVCFGHGCPLSLVGAGGRSDRGANPLAVAFVAIPDNGRGW